MKSGFRKLYAMSDRMRIIAMKDVLPVLFSPTSRVSGARRAVCSLRKHRKFLSLISFMAILSSSV